MQLFDVKENGDLSEIKESVAIKEYLKSDCVFLIVDDDMKRIWIWKGSSAPVRKKFISARAASQLREERGLNYKVSSEDEGDESDSFLKGIGEPPRPAHEVKAPPLREKHQQSLAPNRADVRMDAAKTFASSSKAASEAFPPQEFSLDKAQPGSRTNESFNDNGIIIEKLESVPLPRGFERELVIIGNSVYTVAEHVVKFLGQKQIKKRLEKAPLGTVPEGIFLAEDYTPRVIVNNGAVMAIEFLKKVKAVEVPTHEVSSIKDEMKYHLSDLVDFFKIEIKSENKDESDGD